MTHRPGETSMRLAGEGIRLRIGPFDVLVRSDLPQVAEYLDLFYREVPRSTADGEHFEIGVASTPGWRRWLRPQANLIANGRKPFLPLPASIAGGVFEWGLNWCIGNFAHQWHVIHAAVVEAGGGAMLLSAASGSGKSTLCAAMVLDGWRLFSDEFALVDVRSGELVPVPRPLSLKNQSIDVIRGRSPAVDYGPEGTDVEGARFVHMNPPAESVRRASERAVPRWIVVPKYEPGADLVIEPLPLDAALVHLAEQSFNYQYLGSDGFDSLASLVDCCECYELEYSDLDAALRTLRCLTGQR